ncbi:unnamed protein product [Bursaphelenchus okinawaensis]|uniref:Uncharacterized protein n=1 Tax=Bursaphelenchus okinawaensis TaxID=465554 RepID=A0A811JU68_9BILA|nr:unnamed protein product [Bursaphelenchus okinawaensis]CAG9083096.1 unnamed protein product [Bursaphelenchus okinawaensis]
MTDKWLRVEKPVSLQIPKNLIPHSFYTYSTSLSGKRIYVVGSSKEVVITNDLRALRKLCLLEIDLETKEISSYSVDVGDFTGEVLELYFLAKDLAVLLTYDHRKNELLQYRLIIDRVRKELGCDVVRCTSFDGNMGLRVGVGAVVQGYILVVGRTSREMGDVCKVKMLASDPYHYEHFPDFELDKQMIELERIAHMHPEELYVWPKSVPLLYNESLYFLMAKKEDFSLLFDTSHLGVMTYDHTSNQFVTKIQDVDNSKIKELINHRDMNINYGCMIAQKGKNMWLTFISPAPATHWRWKLQMVATVVCHMFLFVFGRFFIWFGNYDGGYMATKFMHFYLWMMGPSMIPQFGPSPTLRLVSLDLERFQLKAAKVNVMKSALSRFGQVLIDSTPRGDVIMAEMPPRCSELRISRICNPFEPEPLSRMSKKTVEHTFPRLFLEKRLPGYVLQSKSSTIIGPTWNLLK